MQSFLAFLVFALFGALIVGLIKPSIVLRWTSKPTRLKVVLYWFLATLAVGFIGVETQTEENKAQVANKDDVNNTSEDKTSAVSKQWTEVYRFKGNGMKKSPVFELSGGEAKLVYDYKTDSPGLGMGMFAVYLVDEGDDIMKTGGFPEVMTQAENEASESSLQKSEGRYYLNVNASGNWTVIVSELK